MSLLTTALTELRNRNKILVHVLRFPMKRHAFRVSTNNHTAERNEKIENMNKNLLARFEPATDRDRCSIPSTWC